jgi:hypothetical protein
VDWEDLLRWSNIDKALELGVPEPVETYSSSPHLFTDLDIPAGTKGRIAATKRPAGWKPGDDEKPRGNSRPGGKPKPQGQRPAATKPTENKKPRNRTRTYKQGE